MLIISIAQNLVHLSYPQNIVFVMYQVDAHMRNSAEVTSFSNSLFIRQQKMVCLCYLVLTTLVHLLANPSVCVILTLVPSHNQTEAYTLRVLLHL
jgi:hypothetical protein